MFFKASKGIFEGKGNQDKNGKLSRTKINVMNILASISLEIPLSLKKFPRLHLIYRRRVHVRKDMLERRI